MTFDANMLALAGVRALMPYKPGKPSSELERELGISNIIKLASNENPFGPSPLALAAITEPSHSSALARYPDGNGFELKKALSDKLEVDLAQITLGNGSSDILEFVVRTFAGPGHEVIYSEHAFAMYPIVTQAAGATGVPVPSKHWGHDLDAMRHAITDNTRVIFIANPNNPTGTWLDRYAIKSFLEDLPDHVVCVIDEAYFEYVEEGDYPDSLTFLADHLNLVVTRTFSKIYGLAGLRAGYGVASAAITDLINRIRPPFNVNSLALLGATAALEDSTHVENSRIANREGLAMLGKAFDTLGIEYIPSVGNFISFRTRCAEMTLFDALLKKGVIIRPVGNYNMPDFLRVTVGSGDENARFIGCLRESLEV